MIETVNWIESPGQQKRIIIFADHFNDGRIFSLGRQLRIDGYPGDLIAAGDFLPDQLDSLALCGFSHYLPLPDGTDRIDHIDGIDLANLVALPRQREPGSLFSRHDHPEVTT